MARIARMVVEGGGRLPNNQVQRSQWHGKNEMAVEGSETLPKFWVHKNDKNEKNGF